MSEGFFGGRTAPSLCRFRLVQWQAKVDATADQIKSAPAYDYPNEGQVRRRVARVGDDGVPHAWRTGCPALRRGELAPDVVVRPAARPEPSAAAGICLMQNNHAISKLRAAATIPARG